MTTRSYGIVRDSGAAGASSSDGSLSERVASGESSIVQVVCPVLDFFNHRSDSSARVELRLDGSAERSPTAIDIYATQAVRAGEQLFISYGRKSRDRMLASYGFVPQAGPAGEPRRDADSFVRLRGVLGPEGFEARLAAAGVDDQERSDHVLSRM